MVAVVVAVLSCIESAGAAVDAEAVASCRRAGRRRRKRDEGEAADDGSLRFRGSRRNGVHRRRYLLSGGNFFFFYVTLFLALGYMLRGSKTHPAVAAVCDSGRMDVVTFCVLWHIVHARLDKPNPTNSSKIVIFRV